MGCLPHGALAVWNLRAPARHSDMYIFSRRGLLKSHRGLQKNVYMLYFTKEATVAGLFQE